MAHNILYASDHGLLMGEYGMGGKALLYDLATRIPLLVLDPSLPKARRGTTCDAFALSCDIAPTILGYAGLKPGEHAQGRDLRPLLADPNRPWRKDVFLENLYTGRDNPLIEAVRTQRYKYVRYFAARGGMYRNEDVNFAGKTPIFEQLFDLEADPAEKTNLVGRAEHEAALARLRARCGRCSAEQIARRTAYRQAST